MLEHVTVYTLYLHRVTVCNTISQHVTVYHVYAIDNVVLYTGKCNRVTVLQPITTKCLGHLCSYVTKATTGI